MKFADLHVHTFYSDSTFSPREVVDCALERALAGIAICDHDSIDGIVPCIDAVVTTGAELEIIPGIEMTVEKADAEIHLLGYCIGYATPWFCARLREIQRARVDRIYQITDKLAALKVTLDPADVFALAGKGSVGRMHVARALLAQKKIHTIKEAFERYIGFMKPAYVPNPKLPPAEAIEMILKVGGVPVVAHPHLMGNDDYIPELVSYGLRGIEVYHTDHKAHVVRRYETIAQELGLIATGGSDCHGLGKGRVLMGDVRVPYTVVDRLKEEAHKIRHAYR